MAQAYSGYGSLIAFGDEASPEAWSTIALQLEINGLGQEATVIGTTVHNGDGWESCIMGLMKGMPISLKVIWDPNDSTQSEAATGLIGLCNAKTKKHTRLIEGSNFSPVKKWTLYTFVQKVGVVTPLDDKMSLDINLQPTGAQTHT